jgi:hypothetical protein
MMPIVDRLEETFEGQVSIVRLDAGQPASLELQDRWGLRGHPSFAVLDGEGQVAERFFGPQSEGLLRQSMESVES